MGTEEFWIPAAMAALGTGATAYTNASANQKAQASEVQGIQQQQQLREQAAGQVNKTTAAIAASNPQQLQRQATGDFVTQLRANESANNPLTNGTAPAPGANARFASGNATANTGVQQFGSDQATALAAMTAAVRQRQQEGLAMGTLQTGLGLTGQQSSADNFITQLRTMQAGQPNPYIATGGSIISGLGKNMAMNPPAQPGTLSEVAPANAVDYYTPVTNTRPINQFMNGNAYGQ
jgi:hypothetical protein